MQTELGMPKILKYIQQLWLEKLRTEMDEKRKIQQLEMQQEAEDTTAGDEEDAEELPVGE
jgi:hypothetical protein